MIIKHNNITYTIPKPFDECNFGSNPTKMMNVMNRFSDENTTQYACIPAFAVAIYDTIIGAEATEDYKTMQRGITWFQKNFSNAYRVLLD